MSASCAQVILISGLSGSGKSIALRLLEDLGFFCLDNLPATLLDATLDELQGDGIRQVAISVDIRSAQTLPVIPSVVRMLRDKGVDVRFLFLEAKDEVLLMRYSETRRRHPLTNQSPELTVAECIRLEREMMSPILEMTHRIDTSDLKANDLRQWLKQWLGLDQARLTLIFESFGFKHGLPLDADYVFDVRCLPNPYYTPALRPMTGLDLPVADFLRAEASVGAMQAQIAGFLATWLPAFDQDNRSYVTVAIGCTGGQHRSVYLAEQLAAAFASDRQVLVRHRQLTGDARG
ncbi:RNase adapter RapZ [Burkholderiaceae bacterium DAT-1]|nr:RNase adapter RapZ [Burkholderiaceae bacterium DAT-1]